MATHREGRPVTKRPPSIEVVAIGDELILGDTIDTNGAWLGQRLGEEGIRVVRRAVVGDDEVSIRLAITDALLRTGVVVCCGGLGPTPDDRTRSVVASLYGWPVEIDEDWVSIIEERFTKRGMTMPLVNRRQAEVPRGAILLPNEIGTAPGLILDRADLGITVLLPGVPRELRWLVEHRVLPWLRPRLPESRSAIHRRVVRTTGLAESAVAERIADVTTDIEPLTLAFLPVGVGIDLRLTSWGDIPDEEAGPLLDAAEARIRERLGRHVYGSAHEDLAEVVGMRLRERGWTVATAESCTGGLVAKRLTDAPGSSDYMLGGVTSYANEIKAGVLGVPEATLVEQGAVSEPAVLAMLDGIVRLMHAHCAIAITGIAGPGGGSADKPVGTVWIAARTPANSRSRRLHLFGSRAEIRDRAAQAALKMLLDLVLTSAQ
jgi:competence/damage-inducible protein CinA-like protein